MKNWLTAKWCSTFASVILGHIMICAPTKMATLVEALNRLLASGEHKHLLTAIKGLRNGIVYGAKVRFPHACVMTFLFKSGSLNDKLRSIIEATYTHARNLGMFACGYKCLTASLPWGESKSHGLHSFLSTFCLAFIIFGQYNKINEQINLYALSRLLYGLAHLLVEKKIIPQPQTPVFPWFAAIVWAMTMWCFDYQPSCLQPSLVSSMKYLYKDCEKWTSIRNFLIYNK